MVACLDTDGRYEWDEADDLVVLPATYARVVVHAQDDGARLVAWDLEEPVDGIAVHEDQVFVLARDGEDVRLSAHNVAIGEENWQRTFLGAAREPSDGDPGNAWLSQGGGAVVVSGLRGDDRVVTYSGQVLPARTVSWGGADGPALFVSRGAKVHGQVEADGAVFQIRPVGGPLHEIVEIDPAALPGEAEPLVARESGSPAESVARFARSVPRDSIDSIRVLVVYTPAAAAASTDIEAEAQLAVDAANTVTYRTVKLGAFVNGKRAVREGLHAGDQVIVNGLQHVRPGMTVAPELEVASQPTPAPATVAAR